MQDGIKIGYIRTSREDQCLDLQRNALVKAGVDLANIFEEQVSALAKKRPQFDLALKRCRSGDALVIWKLDRLGRSLTQLIKTVGDLEERGVQVVSLTEKIDTTTAMGKLFFHLMAAIAEFERGLVSERTTAGIQAAKDRGSYRTRKVTITEKQWNTMLATYEEDNTRGLSAIANEAGVNYSRAYRYFGEIKQGIAYAVRFPWENQS